MTLFADPSPPPLPKVIDLRQADALATDWPEADLVLTDPPWSYKQGCGASTAAEHYAGLSTVEIADFLGTLQAPRLAMWLTWPLLGEWVEASRGWAWGRSKTGGSWSKSGANDTGH